jgi:hypothetical protein
VREYPICAAARNLDLKQLAESFIRCCVKRRTLKIPTERPESVSVTYDQLYDDLYVIYYAIFCFELPKNRNNLTWEDINIMVLNCLPESSIKALLITCIPKKGTRNFVGIMDTAAIFEYSI